MLPAVRSLTGPSRSGAAPAPAHCDRTANDADSLESAFDAAAGTETICLAPGYYGTFKGGVKDHTVVVRSRQGTSARLALDFDPAANVRVSDVTITSARIAGPSHDVAITHSRFTGLAFVDASEMTDAHILLDANRHVDVDTCTSCYQGRVEVDGDSGRPSGVVISHSLFSGGDSDGIRAGARGLQIVGNEITGLRDQDPFHTDPIQIYGGKQVVIRGNYIHDNDVSAGIMMADGGNGNLVEDNVIAGSGQTWAITWLSDDGSIIRHNTFPDGSCDFDRRCGTINLGSKPGLPAGRGTVITDNVIGGIASDGAQFEADHNLTRDAAPGEGNVTGVPTYAGPPSTFAGHRLAAGSPGSGAASDGRNPGIR